MIGDGLGEGSCPFYRLSATGTLRRITQTALTVKVVQIHGAQGARTCPGVLQALRDTWGAGKLFLDVSVAPGESLKKARAEWPRGVARPVHG